jgi:heat shock protein HslJ
MTVQKIMFVVLAAASAALTACTTVPDGSIPLGGTTWRLVEIQSMDDSQGITRPPNRDLYTIKFDLNGNAFLRLDCNRGSGPWKAERTGERKGSLEFGSIASTRAMCPPGSLSEKVGQQLAFVRTWMMHDGRLHMSLIADGGILVWEPTSSQ